jgi:hypothetical protein
MDITQQAQQKPAPHVGAALADTGRTRPPTPQLLRLGVAGVTLATETAAVGLAAV